MTDASSTPSHFIHEFIEQDLSNGSFDPPVITRFPPEPNGYLHIGHAKAICLDFGTAEKYQGRCHLRFDDTNPEAEKMEYIEAIREDVRWLGFDWGEHEFFASDFFDRMAECAEQLIRQGDAYVCTLSPEEFKEHRGVPTRAGTPSPWRDRPMEENLDLFRRMKEGEFNDGDYVLRAKIDMASPNLHLRDPALYRIKHQPHPRTGNTWCIYPTYDFAHCLEDSFERVTHSLCTLEFEVHRPLYDWILDRLDQFHPRQIEFARLNLSYTVMSKRKLLDLIRQEKVEGWDDPRMPTLCGMRRRGVPPAAIRAFCERVGITKYESLTDVALLEHCIRDELNRTASRRLAVLDPVKLILTNYPEDGEETFEAINNHEDPNAGTRLIPFCRELYIERHDFMEDPPRRFHRLAPGREVRLRYACLITCTKVLKNEDGSIREIHAEWDPASRGGSTPDNRKVKGTIHWVSARHAAPITVRLYDRLFQEENPLDHEDWMDSLNPDSCREVEAFGEPALLEAHATEPLQFERTGYFCRDPKAAPTDKPVFNRTVPLRDSWAKTSR